VPFLPDPDPFFPDLRIRRRLLAALLLGLLVLGAVAIPERTFNGHRLDVTRYTAAGAALLSGGDPYTVTNPRGLHYLYPPLLAVVLAPLATLPFLAQALVWFAVNIVLASAAYGEAVRLLRAVMPAPPRFVGLSAAAAALFPGVQVLKWGQVGILLLYLILLGTRLAVTGTSALVRVAAGLVLAVAVCVKVVPGLPAAVLLLALLIADRAEARPLARCRAVAAGLAVGLLLGLLVVPAAVVGWEANLHHLGTFVDRVVLRVGGGTNLGSDLLVPGNQAPATLLHTWHRALFRPDLGWMDSKEPGTLVDPSSVLWPARTLAALLLAACVLAGARAARDEGRFGVATAVALATLATLFISPIVWRHSFILWHPACLLVPCLLWRRGRRPAASWLAWAPFGFTLVSLLLPAPWRYLPWEGTGAALWAVAACAAVLTGSRQKQEPLPPAFCA
jgi:hypothetical protein